LVDVSHLGEAGESPRGAAILVERRRRGTTVRRVVDVVVVLAVAPVVVPLVLLLALAVKLDSPGPAFWLHQRPGFAGDRFRLYKLRTMFADAEERKAELMSQSIVPWPDFKLLDDPRVTRLGGSLRRTSLDELPQLWNVLRGDLTLVGPRACSLRLEHYELWQTERLEARPGLFGRWQAEGRARVNFEDRCRMDIRQIRSQSLGAEIGLTVKSLVAVMRQRGAS
jgi:lipopolysaccharide/colanic/teichoic acid biosynthesis glycosyltransferase